MAATVTCKCVFGNFPHNRTDPHRRVIVKQTSVPELFLAASNSTPKLGPRRQIPSPSIFPALAALPDLADLHNEKFRCLQ
jgi:hypothetical protein